MKHWRQLVSSAILSSSSLASNSRRSSSSLMSSSQLMRRRASDADAAQHHHHCSLLLSRAFSVRGGGSEQQEQQQQQQQQQQQKYTVLSEPAPGSPFHYAFPVHSLPLAKQFYGEILGCQEGRSSDKWQDYSLHGHQIVAHWAGDDYRCQDHYNPVDGDEVPVPRKLLIVSIYCFVYCLCMLRL